ncbi:hypothetical protein CMK11_14110 [Candidatus Poribacteria bacterium]|nr:hypothetical protein [Candidatus Poribacteria bacterium]
MYEGESSIQYEACNLIQSNGEQTQWGAGDNEPPDADDRITNNINGWINYLKAIRDATAELGESPGAIKGLTSRHLCGLVHGQVIPDPPEPPPPPWPLGAWDPQTDVKPYVQGLCWQIQQDGLEPYVGGWHFADEIFARYLAWTASDVYDTAEAVQTGQENPQKFVAGGGGETSETGVNFPYYWAEQMIITSPASRATWTVVDGKWKFKIPALFKTWVDSFKGTNMDAAGLVLLPDYYPWASPSNRWHYRKHVARTFDPFKGAVSLEVADNPPWMSWSTFLSAKDPYTGLDTDSLRATFPEGPGQYPASKLTFQPAMGLSRQQNALFPMHVDAHKEIRVMLNMRRQWEAHLNDFRLTGFWLVGWNQVGEDPENDGAWHQWTEANSRKYAEAVQNEIGGGTEGIPDVWIDQPSGDLITTGIKAVKRVGVAPNDTRFYIEYHIAPTTIMQEEGHANALVLGEFVLGERVIVKIEIRRTDGPNPNELVRTITEGYETPDYRDPVVPHGKYDAPPTSLGPVLAATTAYWDGFWDNGDDDGKEAPGVAGAAAQYRADLYLNDEPSPVSSLAFQKPGLV